jgi:endonuclease YncB( thermonuclease family)
MKISIFILTLAISGFGQTFRATVTGVSDGDTISIRHADGNLDKVRFLGLDAPEVAHKRREIAQPEGEKCRSILSDLVLNETVEVETRRRDNYGRNLARVFVGETDAGLELLKIGCAWLYYPNALSIDTRALYTAAFINAQANKIGLFAGKAVTPQQWRARKHLKRKSRRLGQ